MRNNFEWAETLPPACPPSDAVQPNNIIFYRLIESNPPREEDFWSQRKLYPSKIFHANECIARSCSLMKTLEGCIDLRKLPAQSNKKIVKITLPLSSGLIKKTGKDAVHHSWWRAHNFNPIPTCEIIDT
jgi:hypothetical protein